MPACAGAVQAPRADRGVRLLVPAWAGGGAHADSHDADARTDARVPQVWVLHTRAHSASAEIAES